MIKDEIQEAVDWLRKQSEAFDNMPIPKRPPIILTDSQIKMFSEAGILNGIEYINIKDAKFNP